MRFLFVDRIDRSSPASAAGRVRFDERSPFRQERGGALVISPGVIGEAMGQLVSWAVMEQLSFKVRPVYLFSESLTTHAHASPGEEVELRGEVSRLTDESVVFSATASVGDRLLQTLTNCSNYFMPLEALEDPETVRRRHAALVSPAGAPLADAGPRFDAGAFVQGVGLDAPRRKLVAHCRIPAAAEFYADHFPKEPITPIVVLNEVISEAVGRLYQAHGLAAPLPRLVEGIKIKSFVRPDEAFEVEVNAPAEPDLSGTAVLDASVKKAGKVILRGRYTFGAAPDGGKAPWATPAK